MKKISFVFVAALSFAAFGCKKQGPDCAKAINNSMGLAQADMKKMPGVDDKAIEKMKDLGIQHCQDDKWPDDAVKCMTEAKTEGDAQACYGKLSHEQQEKMNKAAMDMAKPAGGAGGAGGSDTGSANAGSAPAGAGSAPAGAGSAPAGAGDTGGGSAGSATAPK
jgi:hypothetical protein